MKNLTSLNILKRKLLAAEILENFIDLFVKFILMLSLVFVTIFIYDRIEKSVSLGYNISISLKIFFLLIQLYVLGKFLRYLHRKIKLTNNIEKIALKFGNRDLKINDKLGNLLSLNKENISADFYDKAITDGLKETKNFNPLRLVRLPQYFFYYLGFFICSVLILNPSYERLLNFYTSKDITENQLVKFRVSPGDIEILKGKEVGFTVIINENNINEIMFCYKMGEQNWKYKLLKGAGTFKYNLKQVNENTIYFVKYKNYQSRHYKILISSRPRVVKFRIDVKPPGYSGGESYSKFDDGNISELIGSELRFEIQSDQELQKAGLLFADSGRAELQVDGKKAFGKIRIEKTNNYKFSLTNKENVFSEEQIVFIINAIEDEYPVINIATSNEEIRLSKDNLVRIRGSASDDFGLRELSVFYKLIRSNYNEKLNELNKTIIRNNIDSLQLTFDTGVFFSKLSLSEGSEIEFYFEISDNDEVTGPKKTRSSSYKIVIPSIMEIFSANDKNYKDIITKNENLMKEAEKLDKDLEKLDKDLKKKDDKLNWNEKQKVKDIREKMSDLYEETKEIEKNIKEFQNKLIENNFLSEEIVEKMQSLQKLLDEMKKSGFENILKEMEKNSEKADRSDIQNMLKNVKSSEEMIKKSIEKTMNMLKDMRVDYELNKMIKKSEQIRKDINADRSDEEISKKLDDLLKETKNFEKTADESGDPYNKYSKEPAAQLSESITKKENTKKLEKELQNFETSIKKIQQNLVKENKQTLANRLLRILYNVMDLTQKQEKSINRKKSKNDLVIQKEIATGYDNILKQIEEQSQKTILITPEMGLAFGKTKSDLNQILTKLTEGRENEVRELKKQSLIGLNKTANMLKGLIEFLLKSNSSGGEGGMSLFQQFQKLGQKQISLNEMISQMFEGGLNNNEQAEIKRLAKQQTEIKKSLEQLNSELKSSGKSKSLLQNLDKMVRDMEEMISKMQNVYDDKAKEMHDKILSKMLDAQKSFYEKEFEEERKSNESADIQRESPLDYKPVQDNKYFEDLLKKLENEGYKPDYIELIKKYIEKLKKGDK